MIGPGPLTLREWISACASSSSQSTCVLAPSWQSSSSLPSWPELLGGASWRRLLRCLLGRSLLSRSLLRGRLLGRSSLLRGLLGSCLLGRSRELLLAVHDSFELRTRSELGNGLPLGLDDGTGLRVTCLARGTNATLELAEAGDRNGFTLRYLAGNRANHRLESVVGGATVAVELAGEFIDELSLVHYFPFECLCGRAFSRPMGTLGNLWANGNVYTPEDPLCCKEIRHIWAPEVFTDACKNPYCATVLGIHVGRLDSKIATSSVWRKVKPTSSRPSRRRQRE